ncbi:MAG TPA: c-type cytochrome [Verrucomicrobiales bacterium]|nr:c-type cytochrome [Verrucomicrobiales bacterium]
MRRGFVSNRSALPARLARCLCLDAPRRLRIIASAVCAALEIMAATAQTGDPDPKDKLVVETIRRLPSYDLATAPEKVRLALDRYLTQSRGSEEYFATIRQFRIAKEAPALLELSCGESPEPVRAQAASLALSLTGAERFLEAWKALPDDAGILVLEALPASGADAVAAHGTLLEEPATEPAARRVSLRSLGASPSGQERILSVVASGRLDPALRLSAAEILLRSPYAGIAEAAAEHLELPQSAESEPLPPLEQLARERGDADRGQVVFARLCSSCHRIGEDGIEFGPALTTVGEKLAREAILEAILDPGAAISFGYEGLTVTLKDGRQSLGFVVSETETELTLSLPGGLSESFPLGEIAGREPLPVSLMPANLQAAMSRRELTDLVEYLAARRGGD